MTSATDNRTTELREKLTERGVEYRTTEVHGMPVTLFDDGILMWSVTDHPDGYMIVNCGGLTPEQAIAATLGGEREKALEELVQDWQALYEEPDYGDCCRLRKRMQELGIEVIDE